jgi:hypothetical protein
LKQEETEMQDPFIGTWILNPEGSKFDSNHRPSEATMVLELTEEGHYLLRAEGVNEKGEKCKEKPATFIPDGQDHPVPDFPGLIGKTNRPDSNTLAAEVRREDGSVAGGGTYVVSADGDFLTATNFGYDSQLRQFKQQTVWRRQSGPQ